MSKHTPGPWVVRGGTHSLPEVWSADIRSGECDVASCITDRVFNGNAPLIAAAPDLLAACESALDSLHIMLCYPKADPAWIPTSEADFSESRLVKQLRAAIAKAKGEPC